MKSNTEKHKSKKAAVKAKTTASKPKPGSKEALREAFDFAKKNPIRFYAA